MPFGTTSPQQKNRILAYTTSVSILGALLLAVALLRLPADRSGLLMFSLLVAIAEIGNVELFRTSRNSRVSVSIVVSMAAILALGPLAGVLIEVVSGLANAVGSWLRKGEKGSANRASWLRRFAFNTAMFILSTGAAGQVYLLTGGTVGDFLRWTNILPLLLAVIVSTFLNLALLMTVIVLQTGRSPWDLWNQDFKWSVPINMAGSVVGGSAMALAYQSFGIWGTSVFFLPIFLIGYSFRMYAGNMRQYVNRLEGMNEELNESNIELLETLAAAIDAYDAYTHRHSTHVAAYAGALAQQMGLSETEQGRIVKAALIHDIGKIGISDTITGKEGSLTEDEYNQMRKHPVIGSEILSRMKGLKDIVPLVLSHHEKYDGSGYPNRLRGEEIPLGARVITLADSLEAMCSDRSYRKARPFDQVLAEVQRCSGTHFDPQVVKAFLMLAAERGPHFFSNSALLVEDHTEIPSIGSDADGARRFLKRSLLQP